MAPCVSCFLQYSAQMAGRMLIYLASILFEQPFELFRRD
jgi:hypothetical protein